MREDIIRRIARKQEKEILALHKNIYSVKVLWVETDENEGICVTISYYKSRKEDVKIQSSKRNLRAKNLIELKEKVSQIMKNNGL